MRKLTLLAVVALVAAGCGSTKRAPTTTAPPVPPKPGPGTVLYQGTSWAVVVSGTKATALHLVGDRWRPDRSNRVKITILGPRPGERAARTPQVAVELKAPASFVETALWVDGRELLEKGGGATSTDVTIYGAPDRPLKPGRHVAVAYGRTGTTGTAVAWAFDV